MFMLNLSRFVMKTLEHTCIWLKIWSFEHKKEQWSKRKYLWVSITKKRANIFLWNVKLLCKICSNKQAVHEFITRYTEIEMLSHLENIENFFNNASQVWTDVCFKQNFLTPNDWPAILIEYKGKGITECNTCSSMVTSAKELHNLYTNANWQHTKLTPLSENWQIVVQFCDLRTLK